MYGHLRWLTTVFWDTIARAEKFSLTPFFFHTCNTLHHHREKAENTSDIWLVEIAQGVLLAFFIMNGRSLEVVSERYQYKISCKTLTKTPRSCCENSYVYHARHIAFCSMFLSCMHAQFCSRRRSQKITNRLFDPNLLENWPYNPQ